LVVIISGCSPSGKSREPTGRTSAQLATKNGLTENGLTENGLTENGLTENGLTENGLTENGLTENGLTENGLTENGLTALDLMKADPNVIAFVQYLYSCAMPKGAHMELTFEHTGEDGGLTNDPVSFDGAIGLAPEWGLRNDSKCDDNCQKWVSACILARVNAYGQHVDISLRAPRGIFAGAADGGVGADSDALGRTDGLKLSSLDGGVDTVDGGVDEADVYPLREGAYYGNIFATVPSGTLNIKRPKFYACSGPASSMPQLTNRFCSSTGDDCIIYAGGKTSPTVNPQPPPFPFTWETCAEPETDTACALDLDPVSGAIHDCKGVDGNIYTQVLTIYLKQPIIKCGNGRCEAADPAKVYPPGTVFEDSTNCPDDCHPGTWAKGIDLKRQRCPDPSDATLRQDACYATDDLGQLQDLGRRQTVDSDGNVIRILDRAQSSGNVDFGGVGGDAATSHLGLFDPTIAKYSKDGDPIWSTPIGRAMSVTGPMRAMSVTTDLDKNVIIAGTGATTANPVLVTKHSDAGAYLWTSFALAQFPSTLVGPVATDSGRNIVVVFSPDPPFTVISKLEPTAGSLVWQLPGIARADGTNIDITRGAMAIDGSDNVYLTDQSNIYRFSSAGVQDTAYTVGAAGIVPGTSFMSIAVEPDGSAYIAGTFQGMAPTFPDIGGGPEGPGMFVVKRAPTGTFLWAKYVLGTVVPIDLRVDPFGVVMVAGGFQGDGTGPNFGAPLKPFDTEGSPDTFIEGLSTTDGSFVWAKQLKLWENGGLDSFSLGNQERVFASGGFSSSMLLDDFQLLNANPGKPDNQELFVGSFTAPCGQPDCDKQPPDFDFTTVPGAPGSQVSHPIIVYAVDQAGATVNYTKPAARNHVDADPSLSDKHFDGISVVCLPRSGTHFPIGVTPVNCTASDPHGNFSSVTFPITVLGTAGPVWQNVPADITVDAASAAGTIVNYQTPTAIDLIDGQRTVTCVPPSGSLFPVGSNTVDCSATDAASPPNTTHVKFHVNVVSHTPPVITVPTPGIVVDATSPNGANVTYNASAVDFFGNPVPVTCVPPSGSHFPLGITTVICTATDSAGNTGTASFTVQVRFGGFRLLPPVRPDGSSVFRLGQTVPVKFKINPNVANIQANLTLAKITNGVAGPEQDAVSSGFSNIGNLFRYDPFCKLYIFNLSTRNLSPGTWRLTINLHDGTTHQVNITLKTWLSLAEWFAANAECGCDD
jgi:hypothetical protein